MGNCCSGGERDIDLNGRRLRSKRLLGEGGFAYVYLVEDVQTSRQYALKRALCQEEDQVEKAVREAQFYREFDHANLMKIIDYSVEPVRGSTAQEVLMLFPCYRSGSLASLLANMAERGAEFSETEALALFISVCTGVKELHTHEPPYAHRDIKPGNILLTDNNTPVLMDFGSVTLARVQVRDRSHALEIQDQAAENSTAPYRAPELFDVPSDGYIDERVDVWSLGCLLYAIAFQISPFESAVNETGGSLALAAMSGRVVYPKPCSYSKNFCDLIAFMLNTNPDARPHIDEVIERGRSILRLQLNPM